MAIIAKNKTGEYSTAPEGLWSAVCVDVEDLGLVPSQWGDKAMVRIYWLLEELDEKTAKPFQVSQRYTLSLHEKSRLRPMLEAWRGRKFTVEELEGFDLEVLIGVNCQVQVIHNLSNQGGTFANVQAVVPPARGTQRIPVPKDYLRHKDRKQETPEKSEDYGPISDEEIPF